MLKKYFLAIFLFSSFYTPLITRNYPAMAVCIVPVANCFNEYLSTKFPGATEAQIEDVYKNLLASNESTGLMRIHQLRFNDIVEVVEEHGCECIVRCNEHFTQNKPDQNIYNTYAFLKKNLLFLEDLPGNIQEYLPEPYVWFNGNSFDATRAIVTLTMPFTDEATGVTYSIGTRFKLVNTNPHFVLDGTAPFYTLKDTMRDVYILKSNGTIGICAIPCSQSQLDYPMTNEEKESCILDLFFKYTNYTKKAPTAFGGNSTTELHTPADYAKTSLELPNGEIVKGFTRPLHNSDVQTGFTMPELNMTINNTCQVPSFFKNTTTMFRLSESLQPDQKIEKLDYIVGTGYMGRVISVEENLIGDIRSYSHHNGIARLTPLSKNFKNIETYADLQRAFFEGQPLELTNDEGKVIATCKPGQWKIVKHHPNYDQKFSQDGEFYKKYGRS